MPADTHCVMISQIAVVTANVVPEMPLPGQGDMEAKPKPEPSANRTRETAIATNAPAMIAGHDAADLEGVAAAAPPLAYVALTICSTMMSASVVRTHGEQQNYRQRHT